MTDPRVMKKRYRLIQHLYGETEQSDLPQNMLNDEKLRAEYLELREIKGMLDRLQEHASPDRDILDRIVQSLRPRRRRAVIRPLVWSMSMSTAAAIIGFVVIADNLRTEVDEPPMQSSAPVEISWDEGGSVVDIHSRIELLNARSHTGLWDDEDILSMDSVVLGVQPGLEAASTR